MSVNKLNLQIGGPNPEELKRKVLDEVERNVERKVEQVAEELVSQQSIDDLFEILEPSKAQELVVEEVEAPLPETQSVRKTRPEMMAESMARYHNATKFHNPDPEPKSAEERLDLLEHAFEGMKSSRPGTLVSGIGASLDSGGGAVWLWDLEDVNIGTPLNGTYPNIEDGAVLQYDRDRNQWEPGAPGGGGGGSISDITQTFLDFDGTQTAQAIRVFGATDKVFEIEVGDTQAETPIVARFESNPNKLVLPSGQLESSDVHTTTATVGTLNTGTIQGDRIGVLWKLSAGDGLAFDGQASSHIGGTPGETGGNAYSVGFGTLKVGTTVLRTTGSQVITGDKTYTGATTNPNNLQTRTSVDQMISDAVTQGFTFKGTTDITGAAPENPAAGDFYINLVAGVAANSWTGIAGSTIAADQLIIYSGDAARWFAGAVEDNNTYLSKTGGTMTGDITMDNDSVINFSNSQAFPPSITADFLLKSGGTMSGTLVTDEVEVPNGKTLTIQRGANNTSSSGLDIKGFAPNQVGLLTDIFGVSYGNGTTTGDSINYKGRTDGNNNLQTKASVQALISGNSPTGFVAKTGDTMTGELQIDISSSNPSNIALEIEEDGSTNFRVLRTGFVSSKVLTCTGINTNGPTAANGNLTITGDTSAQALTVAGDADFSNPVEISGVNSDGSDNVFSQDGRITFDAACDDGFIGKRGGTNNFLKFGAGNTSAGQVVATMGLLENGKKSFTSTLTTSDFIGASTVWNKRVAESYNVVNGTAATYNEDGDLLSATVDAPITFTGNNIHSGTVQLDNTTPTHTIETIGTNNRGLVFKNQDNSGAVNTVMLLGSNASQFYSPLVISGSLDAKNVVTVQKTRTNSDSNSFVIKGRIGGTEGATLFKDFQRQNSASGLDDYIEYFGGSATPNSILNRAAGDARYLQLAGGTVTGDIKLDTGKIISNSNNLVTFGQSDSNYFNGGLNIQRTSAAPILTVGNGGKVTIERVGDSSEGFTLVGKISDGEGGTLVAGKLLQAYHNGGSTFDAVNYNGRTDSATNLMNRSAVASMLAGSFGGTDTTVIPSGTFNCELEAQNIGSGVTPQNPSTLVSTTGYYYKIGKLVFITANFSLINTTQYFGQAVFKNLPFTAAASAYGPQIIPIFWDGTLANQLNHDNDDMFLAVQPNSTVAYVYNNGVSPLNPANIASTSSGFITFSGHYMTA